MKKKLLVAALIAGLALALGMVFASCDDGYLDPDVKIIDSDMAAEMEEMFGGGDQGGDEDEGGDENPAQPSLSAPIRKL
jgi:hypothetical protein